MNEPDLIWRLGRWVAGRSGGVARLGWSAGELEIEVCGGRIQAVRGVDASEVATKLDTRPTDHDELLAEARAVASTRSIPETRAVGAAKAIVQQALRSWLVDESRTLTLTETPPEDSDGATISITHALVELILADSGSDLTDQILPDRGVLLRRTSSFLELYAPLRLSEEADLIVAKTTGQRTAAEIADRSPHGTEEVMRLLAALVATGMLEPVPVATPADDQHDMLAEPEVMEPLARRRLPVSWIAVGLAATAIVIAIGIFAVRGAGAPDPGAAEGSGRWAVAVDMGCAPEELQRVLAKARQHPKDLRPLVAPASSDDPCWRLVWGQFPSREEAEEAIPRIPGSLTRDGFEPHSVELPDDGEVSTPPIPGG